MSTKIVEGTFMNIAENCDRNMSSLCTTTQNGIYVLPDKKTNWTNAFYSCENGQFFVGVKNSSKSTFNANNNNSYWVGMFRIELLRTPCKTSNVSIKTLIPQTSTQPSLSTPSNAQEHTSSSDVMKTQFMLSVPSTHTQQTTIYQTSSSSPVMNVTTNDANNEFPTLVVGAGTGGAVLIFIVSLTMAFVIYRRRKTNRNGNPEGDFRESFDNNSINMQQTSAANNDHIKYGRNTECNNERERATDGVYNHLKGYQNNRTSVAFSNSAYDHVTPYRITSQTVRDDNTYDNFSKKKERTVYSGDDYNHVVRHSDTYDHLGKMGNVTMDAASENYDRVSGRFLKSPDQGFISEKDS
ncbi:uncharacterized protein [Argopecten irradians]|uniref:uncharacterized protein n=1 Tax=Argopecten irradians TaxID=31199 RepID=UPI003719F75B